MNELQTEMFRNEVACLRLVRHPNIVRMLAMFETPEKVRLGAACAVAPWREGAHARRG